MNDDPMSGTDRLFLSKLLRMMHEQPNADFDDLAAEAAKEAAGNIDATDDYRDLLQYWHM